MPSSSVHSNLASQENVLRTNDLNLPLCSTTLNSETKDDFEIYDIDPVQYPPWGGDASLMSSNLPSTEEEILAACEAAFNNPAYEQPVIASQQSLLEFPHNNLQAYYVRYITMPTTNIIMRQWQSYESAGIVESLVHVDFAHSPHGTRIEPMPFSIRSCVTGKFVEEEWSMVRLTLATCMYTINVRGDPWKMLGEINYMKPTTTVDEKALKKYYQAH